MDKKKAGCGTFLIVWIIVTVIMTVVFMTTNEAGQSVEIILSGSVAIGFFAAAAVYIVRMMIKVSTVSKEERAHRKEDKQKGISRYDGILHVGGLDAPENCRATFELTPDALMMTCGGREYILKIKKIRNVEFRYDINETKYMQSHLRRGIIGAAMFGEIGAIIGSAPTTKTKRDGRGYAIIFYENSQGELNSFLLKDEKINTQACAKLTDALEPKINQQAADRVEL